MQFFDTGLIEERLKDPQFGIEQVGGAADYAAVKSLAEFRPGSVYVVMVGETNPTGNQPQPQFKAPAMATFGVIIAARNYRDQTGKAALNDIVTLAGNVRSALLGWAPKGAKPCVWQEGNVAGYDRSTLLWIDVFTTTHVLGGSS